MSPKCGCKQIYVLTTRVIHVHTGLTSLTANTEKPDIKYASIVSALNMAQQ